MSVKLFVGSLNYEATEQDVRDLFAPYGPIEDVWLATDKYTGNPRGFAFVTLAAQEPAEEAIRSLDGSDFGGRALVVNVAREKPAREGGYRGGDGGRKSFRDNKRGRGGRGNRW